MKAKGQFTSTCWEAIKDIYNDTLNHEFVQALADGSLPKKSFAHYLAQDILYIADDSKALEILSTRCENKDHSDFFKAMAEDGIEIERILHNEFLNHFDVKTTSEKSSAIERYTQFLLNHANKSKVSIAAASLLPCFWVYNMVGNHIINLSVENNPYQKWIDTYEGEEYEEYTEKFITIVEELAHQNPESQAAMLDAFVESTRLELEFFDEAWNID